MKTNFFNARALLTGALLAGALATGARAQMLGGLTVSPATAVAGTPVTVTASVDVISGNFCGLIVFFGDGTSAEAAIDVGKPSPFVTTHVYANPGQYALSMGGRSVQSHPNCGGPDKLASVTITPKPAAAAPATPAVAPSKPASAPKVAVTAATVCPANWKVTPKSFSAKSGAYSCFAKAGTALPTEKAVCPGELTYFENVKKGQFGCRP